MCAISVGSAVDVMQQPWLRSLFLGFWQCFRWKGVGNDILVGEVPPAENSATN